MSDPTRSLHPLSLNAILALAGLAATLCVVAMPAPKLVAAAPGSASTATATAQVQSAPLAARFDADGAADGRTIQRAALPDLTGIGRQAGDVIGAVEAVTVSALAGR